jgi:hypothetical protein
LFLLLIAFMAGELPQQTALNDSSGTSCLLPEINITEN